MRGGAEYKDEKQVAASEFEGVQNGVDFHSKEL
jgi:hypothetical protein